MTKFIRNQNSENYRISIKIKALYACMVSIFLHILIAILPPCAHVYTQTFKVRKLSYATEYIFKQQLFKKNSYRQVPYFGYTPCLFKISMFLPCLSYRR